MELFVELSLIIMLVTGISIVMKLLKQPFIVGYIISGILAGPYFLDILNSTENIELFSKMGITILLFIIGLNLSPRVIKEVGKISLITGIGQVIFTSLVGFLISSMILGFSVLASLYIAIALTFSSTIIILKLLTDKGDTESLYGKISIGFLLVQDLVATLILIIVPTIAGINGQSVAVILSYLIVKGILLTIVLILVNKTVMPAMMQIISTNQELLLLFSITWGMSLASLFYLLGFSIEIGALVAGVMLSTSPYATEVSSRMKPLRDFFTILFFILIGSQMVLGTISQLIVPGIVLSLFVLVGNPIIVMILMNVLKFKRKTGFLAGLTVAQISEFSLIFANMGLALGHISEQTLSLITLVGLLTIAGSTYLILYADPIYPKIQNFIRLLEIRSVRSERPFSESESPKIILFGYDRVGTDFVEVITELKRPFLVVDYNPASIRRLKDRNLPHLYGDAGDIELLEELKLANVELIISTIPDFDTNKLIVQKLSDANPDAISIVVSHNVSQSLDLYEAGASYVIMPIYLGARYAADMIRELHLETDAFQNEKEKHLAHLARRVIRDKSLI